MHVNNSILYQAPIFDAYNIKLHLFAALTDIAAWPSPNDAHMLRNSVNQVIVQFCSGCFMPAVVKLQDKHWIKRPLHNNIIEYVVAGVDPLCHLGVQMMTKSGETVAAAAIRFSYLNVESSYDDDDMEHSELFYR